VAARKEPSKDRLYATRWVHVFEEDTAEGAVYRPEDDKVPLSRRPRERLEIRADGSAQILAPGPDDRFVAQPASWTEEKDGLVIQARHGGPELRIVQRAPDRLVVKTESAKKRR
jgi:hypothetical protein